MYCDGCGIVVQPGQSFCSKCGKQIVGQIAMIPQRRGRVQEHVRLLGLLWLAFSAFNTLGAVTVYILANTLFARMAPAPDAPMYFLRPLMVVVAVLLFAKAALGFVGGWGLLQHEKWARVLVLVLAFVSMFTNIPFGTALGVYTLWVLLPADSDQEYEALSEAQAA